MKKTNVAILVTESGCNTNLGYLLPFGVYKALCVKSANFPVMLTNKRFPYIVEKIVNPFMTIEVVDHNDFDTREEFETEMIRRLEKYNIGLVVLAGFLRVLTPLFLNHYKNRVINIHPGLSPSFPGVNATQQALDYGVKVAGCTAHFVDEGIDTGPIILQATVPVKEKDNEDTLLRRIFREEIKVIFKAIEHFCEGRLSISGRKVIIKS
jgi:phosphoribosylglycinamide formyltransferase-1